jgi:hypothetical protein
MHQYTLSGKSLTLKVKKSPLLVRSVMYFFSFLFFALPIAGFVSTIVMGEQIKFGHFIMLGVFGLLGGYMWKISLWNTHGTELIQLSGKKIEYQASYLWFKGPHKIIEVDALEFSIVGIGYEEDNLGLLEIKSGEKSIRCVTKMPEDTLRDLITILEKQQQ